MQKQQKLPQKDVFMRRFFKLKLLVLGIVLTNSQLSFAGNETANFEASAKIENFCSIQASDVNFGVVALPLTAQSANAQMKFLCSNNTPYKVDLTYGNYVTTKSTTTIKYFHSWMTGDARHTYYVYNDVGNSIGYISCGFAGIYTGKVYISNPEMAKIYQYPQSARWYNDVNKVCQSDGTAAGTKPTGWEGAYNASSSQPVGGIKNSEFGLMSGTQKGDKLAYSFTLPEDSSKAWSKGFNSYNATGIGSEQIIDVNAKIVLNKSSSTYVAQDVYLDNVTAEITY